MGELVAPCEFPPAVRGTAGAILERITCATAGLEMLRSMTFYEYAFALATFFGSLASEGSKLFTRKICLPERSRQSHRR